MIKIVLQILLVLLIIGTIKDIKKGNLRYGIESYILSIIIYTILIIILF
ncbi:MAG: hypothetical protein MST00_03425 [Tenericutes bacterium]|nr:hypothetical protein [Mycoplasmatota bacterium]